jgi:AcrR family transcriptional regulator
LKKKSAGNTKQPKNGTYPKGQERAVKILDAAEKLLLEQGYHSLSLRNVAAAAGLSMSNLQYYFPNKDQMIQALMDKIIQAYLDQFGALLEETGENAEEQFIVVISHVINDLNNKKTTSFFPELWALANHTDHVTEIMDNMYAKYRHIVEKTIKNINPGLSAEQSRKLTLFVTSSIEGHTMFIGYGKPWKKDTPDIIKMAAVGFLHLIKNPPI